MRDPAAMFTQHLADCLARLIADARLRRDLAAAARTQDLDQIKAPYGATANTCGRLTGAVPSVFLP